MKKVSLKVNEQPIIAGNIYDKYGSKNLIVKIIMKNFLNKLNRLIFSINAKKILDAGCREGHLCSYIKKLSQPLMLKASIYQKKL